MTPFYSPGVGGSSRLMVDIAEHLRRKGHTVEVLTYGLGDPAQLRTFDASQPYLVHRVAPGVVRGTGSISMLIRGLGLQLRRGFDLVVCGAAFPTAILASVVSLATGVRYAVYSHGEDATVVEGTMLRLRLLRFALQRASVILTNSRFTLAKIEQIGVPAGKAVWAPPGIDPSPYERVTSAEVDALRVRLDIPAGPILLTVARLTPRKGHDTVIKALAAISNRVPDVHYVIVGKGDAAQLKSLAKRMCVADRVTFIEYLAEEDLPALYALCDVHVMVSRWDPESQEVEGFGIVYLEAGAAGRPSVAGTAGGCSDAIENGRTGLLVDPTNQLEVAEALYELLTSADRATQMGNEAQRWVRERFERTSLLDQLEVVLARR
jgi:phosphatidyl-myo-inositol dimannoside synthase